MQPPSQITVISLCSAVYFNVCVCKLCAACARASSAYAFTRTIHNHCGRKLWGDIWKCAHPSDGIWALEYWETDTDIEANGKQFCFFFQLHTFNCCVICLWSHPGHWTVNKNGIEIINYQFSSRQIHVKMPFLILQKDWKQQTAGF